MEKRIDQVSGSGNVTFHQPKGFFLASLLIPLLFMCFSSCTVYVQKPEEGMNVQLPSWAPAYENMNRIRYYYFPDIECYYDVWNKEFVYLEDGNWMFGSSLPPLYSWFDLNRAFIVLLNYNVFEPWRHFHYYVSHYPRYYYRSFYRDRFDDVSNPVRGFNENSKITVNEYRRGTNIEERRENIRNELREEGKKPGEAGRISNINREGAERRVAPTRPAQRMEYQGKNIGRPVKVQKNMMKERGSRR